MQRIVAIKKLGKMLGKTFAYRIDPKAPTLEQRDEARQQLPALIAARQEAKDALDARRAELLADPQYCALLTALKAAREATERAHYVTRHYKITVGNSSGIFFHIRAEGDSWEEVIAKLQTNK